MYEKTSKITTHPDNSTIRLTYIYRAKAS